MQNSSVFRNIIIIAVIGIAIVALVLFLRNNASETAPQEALTPPAPEFTPQDNLPHKDANPTKSSYNELVAAQQNRVFFAFDKFNLTQNTKATLKRQARWLKQNPDIHILIEGHADERGSTRYNLRLGTQRAQAIRTHLINLGIDANRIETTSWGESKPIALCSDETCWSQNRRAITRTR